MRIDDETIIFPETWSKDCVLHLPEDTFDKVEPLVQTQLDLDPENIWTKPGCKTVHIKKIIHFWKLYKSVFDPLVFLTNEWWRWGISWHLNFLYRRIIYCQFKQHKRYFSHQSSIFGKIKTQLIFCVKSRHKQYFL